MEISTELSELLSKNRDEDFHRGETLISSMKTEVLESFLNDCLSINEEPMNSSKLKLLFKFPLLIPAKKMDKINDQPENLSREGGNSKDQVELQVPLKSSNEEKLKSLRETEIISDIGESYEHRHLLQHPVIDTFVSLKWTMAQDLYIRRIRFFWLFAVILTSEIFNQYEKKTTTCDEGCILKKILLIFLPMLLLIVNVLYNFLFKGELNLKRLQKYSFDWFLILIFMGYASVVFVHGLHHSHDMKQSSNSTAGLQNSSNKPSQDEQNSHASEYGKFILILVWFMNLSRFLVTCFYGKFSWHSHWIMETLMMVSVATKLVFRITCNREHANQTLENTLAAFALTISWSVFATEFATVWSTINIYVEMFYKILNTMVITTVGGLFLLLSFASGFEIIWDQSKSQKNNQFNSTMNSITKTMAMFVGELDYSDDMQGHTDYDKRTFWTHHLYQLYLLTFIFFAMVVYNNFLNGLAVSDVGKLLEESVEVTMVQRIDIILTYEYLSEKGLEIENKFKEKFKNKCLEMVYNVIIRAFFPLLVPRKFVLLPDDCKEEMEFTFKKNSRPKWFQKDCDMKKVFSYIDSEGDSAEIGLKKSKFKEIEKLMSSKEKKEELRHTITKILSNKQKDDDCKISELLSAMNKD